MKKLFKIIACLVSFFLTALSVSEALKKKEELTKTLKSDK